MTNRTALLATASLTAAVAFFAGQATSSAVQSEVHYGGAIRCTNGVWGTIEDAGHQSEGITSVTATSTYVQVNHTHVDKVRTAMYGWDNDYPMNGFYVTGASGGTDFDRFYFLKNGSRVDPATACDLAYTNVWVDGSGYVG